MIARGRLLTIGLSIATLVGLLLSRKLWLSSRTYPLAPVFDFLPTIPSPFDWIWLVVLLLLLGIILLMSILRPTIPRAPILVFVVLAGLLCLWDQTRWQPWAYQYLFMFAVLGLAPHEETSGSRSGLNACRLIVASMYFWSGLQKCNYTFFDETYGLVIVDILDYFSEPLQKVLESAKYAVPFLEAGIGIALLVPKVRRVAVVLVILMHAFLLFALGPLGSNYNSIVWPWNIAMVFFVLVLFTGPTATTKEIIWPRNFLFARVTLLLFGILPALSFVNCWDSYLSASLYSGNITDAVLRSNDTLEGVVPQEAVFVVEGEDAWDWLHEVDFQEWSMAELNVPPYPEPRVYRSIARSLAERVKPRDGLKLVITGRPNLWTGHKETHAEMFRHQ